MTDLGFPPVLIMPTPKELGARMTASNLQKTIASSYDGWTHSIEQLKGAAERLGLALIGWGAIPTDPPEIKIDNTSMWTCPHCGETQAELQAWQINDTATLAEAIGKDAEPGLPHWEVPIADLSTDSGEVFAWTCYSCNGFVQPSDEVEMGE